MSVLPVFPLGELQEVIKKGNEVGTVADKNHRYVDINVNVGYDDKDGKFDENIGNTPRIKT